MALSVLTSVQIHCTSILAIITNTIVLNILRTWLSFSNLKDWWLLQILMITVLLCVLICREGSLISKKSVFVGAITDVNCNELNSCAIVTKKNTPISRRSVLVAVRCDHWSLNNSMVSHRINTCNIFAVIYV